MVVSLQQSQLHLRYHGRMWPTLCWASYLSQHLLIKLRPYPTGDDTGQLGAS